MYLPLTLIERLILGKLLLGLSAETVLKKNLTQNVKTQSNLSGGLSSSATRATINSQVQFMSTL